MTNKELQIIIDKIISKEKTDITRISEIADISRANLSSLLNKPEKVIRDSSKVLRLLSAKFPVYFPDGKSNKSNKTNTFVKKNAKTGQWKIEYENGDIPQEKYLMGEMNATLSRHEERLLRIEAHIEVYESAIAGLLSESKGDFSKRVDELREQVAKASKRRFDELSNKPG